MSEDTSVPTPDSLRRESAGGAPSRAVRCTLLVPAGAAPPESLIRSFRSRGVEVGVETEPLLALAELGRRLLEHRQLASRDSTFHEKRAVPTSRPHPSLILVIVEPRAIEQVEELVACVARSMPQVTVSAFDGTPAVLRVVQRGRPERQSTPAPARHPQPIARTPGPRRGLRLTADDREEKPPQPAPWLTAEPHESEDQPAEPETESLISKEELAMLLGDDYGSGDDPTAGTRTP